MKRANKTRSTLVASILSLLLCVSMLIGATFAWFTDTASTGVNTIKSGNLDLVLEYRTAEGEWEEVTKDTLLFNKDALYEPGYTEVAYLRVKNAGQLALKYDLSVNVANEVSGINKDGKSFKLSDYIKFGVITSNINVDMPSFASRDDAQKAAAPIAEKLQTYTTNGYVALDPGEFYTMALVVFMPTTVGNEVNHDGINIPSITMGVNVFATQKDAEEDSYGPNYDLNAPMLVVMNGLNYDTLNAAIEAAEEGAVITVGGNVPYVMPATQGQNISFKGVTLQATDKAPAVITFKNADGSETGGCGNTITNVTLKNVTVVDETFYGADRGENSWEFTYLEMANITAEDVIFTDGIMLDGNAATTLSLDVSCDNTFVNCTFIGHNNDSSALGDTTMYGAWVNSGSASFEGCTFTGTRGLKVHDGYTAGAVSAVYVDNCIFENLSEKPGVVLGDLTNAAISITDSKFINVQPGDQSMYFYESDTAAVSLVNEGNTVDINGLKWDTADTYTIDSVDGLFGFAREVNENGNNFYKKTVVLANDIDLNNQEWTPVGTNAFAFRGTFDGNNKTISNLKITGNKSYVGLFGRTNDGEIKNLTVNNASVQGYLGVGVIAGSPYTSKYTNITLTGDVKVDGYAYVGGVGGRNAYASWTDVTVNANAGSYVRANSEHFATYVGGVIGFVGEGNKTLTNLKSNIDVYGSTCYVGGIVGIAHYGTALVDCSYSGTATLANTDAGDNTTIGAIAGVWMNSTAGNVTLSDCSSTGTLVAENTDGSPVVFEYEGLVGRKYTPSSNDGKLTVNGKTYVAPVNDPAKVEEALEKQDTVIVDVGNDTVIKNDTLYVPAGKELTVESGKIDASSNYSIALSAGENTKITLTDGSYTAFEYAQVLDAQAKGAEIVANGGVYEGNYLAYVAADAKVTVNGGTFATPGYPGTVLVACSDDSNTAVVTITGGTFYAEAICDNFVDIYITGGTFYLDGISHYPSLITGEDIIITGGTFDVDPSAYVAAGYAAVNNGNGTWTVNAQ